MFIIFKFRIKKKRVGTAAQQTKESTHPPIPNFLTPFWLVRKGTNCHDQVFIIGPRLRPQQPLSESFRATLPKVEKWNHVKSCFRADRVVLRYLMCRLHLTRDTWERISSLGRKIPQKSNWRCSPRLICDRIVWGDLRRLSSISLTWETLIFLTWEAVIYL